MAFCPACGSPQAGSGLTLPPPTPTALPGLSLPTPSTLTPPPLPTPSPVTPPAPPTAPAKDVQPPSWQPDPFARYTYRYWNGRKWTNQVSNGGNTLTDPLGAKGTPLPSPDGNDLAEAGWYPDPAGRHQHRYWKGRRWTDQVADNGVVANDPANVEGIEV